MIGCLSLLHKLTTLLTVNYINSCNKSCGLVCNSRILLMNIVMIHQHAMFSIQIEAKKTQSSINLTHLSAEDML